MSLVRFSVSGRVAHVTLARAEKRNAINAELAADLHSVVASIATDEVRSIILTAQGPVFCAGADLSDLDAAGKAVDDVIKTLTGAPFHWTVVVRQPVLGAGLALLGACPLVLATKQATFALPELRKGFFPTDLMAGQIAAMGARAAYDLAFSARPMNAERAVTVGLITEVVDEADIDRIATDRATEVASRDDAGLTEGIAHWQNHARRMLLACK